MLRHCDHVLGHTAQLDALQRTRCTLDHDSALRIVDPPDEQERGSEHPLSSEDLLLAWRGLRSVVHSELARSVARPQLRVLRAVCSCTCAVVGGPLAARSVAVRIALPPRLLLALVVQQLPRRLRCFVRLRRLSIRG